MRTNIIISAVCLFFVLAFVSGEQNLTLEPRQDEHVIEAGDSWTIACHGKREVQWHYPQQAKEDIALEFSRPQDNSFVSVLTLTNASYLNTGEYICNYTSSQQDFSGAVEKASTYLYVSDGQHLLADDGRPMVITVRAGMESQVLVPCRATHPDVKMSVQFGDETVANQTQYNPESGMTIKIRASKATTLKCIAEFESKIQELNVNVHVLPRIKLFKPHIKVPEPGYFTAGQRITLICDTIIPSRTAPDFDLQWIPPKNDSHYIIGELRRDAKSFYPYSVKFMRTLTIDLDTEDQNQPFKCLSTKNGDKSDPSTHQFKKIRRNDREAHIGHVNFNGGADIQLDLESYQGKDIKWILTVFAAPDPEYHWYDPKGRTIDTERFKKYSLTVNSTTHQVELEISDVQLSDMGQYELDVLVDEHYSGDSKLKKVIDMSLTLKSEPQVSLNPHADSSFYLAEKETNFTCKVQGYPIDLTSLQWTFQACNSYDSCSEAQDLSPDFYSALTPSDGNVEKGSQHLHYEYKSILSMTLLGSGIYSCKVCSLDDKAHCQKDETRVFLNDFSHAGFFLSAPKDDIIQGDDVNLTCAASIYDYSEIEWLKKDKKGEWESYNGAHYEETEFSYVAKINLKSISTNQGGDYKCVAYPATKNKTEETVKLNVLRTISPRMTDQFNMDEPALTLNKGDTFKLDCSIATGRPKPTITWFKDGQPFEEPYNSSSIEFSPDNESITFQFLYLENSGEYECRASNRAGTNGGKRRIEVKDPITLPSYVIALIVCGCAVVALLTFFLLWRVKVYQKKYKQLTAQELKMFENGDPRSINPELGVDDQADLLPYNKSFEFPREFLKLGKQLGSGAFGRVVKAQAIGINAWERSSTVAVKMVKPNADIMYVKALMSELKIMIHLGKHLNIVNLLGACTKGLARKELYVIVEYCRFGNLQKYLLQHRGHFIDQVDPVTGDINFNIGQDVIDGYGNNSLARAREEEEMSAVYLRQGNTADSTQAIQVHGEPKRQSVRYVVNPSKKKSTISIQSDYSGGPIMTTDMTTLPEEDEDESHVDGSKPVVNRTQSMVSRVSQEPGWRANMRGDYDASSVKPISTKDLICWAYQVTRGMEYLASKRVMHGDLACRNILLAADNVVKICDFGLAKDIYKNNEYQKKSDGPLPVKWMAIESIRDRVFSTQSDVWAFGIVLWEMFSMGKTPYPGVEACDLYNLLAEGKRMEKPEFSPQSLYDIMKRTWDADPNARPNFLELMDELGDLLEEGEKDHYLDLTKRFDASTNGTNNAVENKDYLAMMSPPDFTTQMSVSPSQQPEEEEDGYLEPKREPFKFDKDDYLMPNGNHNDIEMASLMANGGGAIALQS